MLPIITFKWQKHLNGDCKYANFTHYTSRHVNVLRSMLERHLQVDHKVICVTDDPEDLDPRIEVMPLWPTPMSNGCYRRLHLFDKDFTTSTFGSRIAWIDLDCVILKNVTDIFTRHDPFIMKEYASRVPGRPQEVNASFCLMDVGVHQRVWDAYIDPIQRQPILDHIEAQIPGHYIGTEQAFIQAVLGPGITTIGPPEGVYEVRKHLHFTLRPKVKMMFFSGNHDPSRLGYPQLWLKEHWV